MDSEKIIAAIENSRKLTQKDIEKSKQELLKAIETTNAKVQVLENEIKESRIKECCFSRWQGMLKALVNNMQVSLSTAKASIAAMAVLYNIKLEYVKEWNYDDSETDDSDSEDEEFRI
ncbi:hypothetical protein CBL_02991 [Carabus blaptoides fortunei]